MDIKDLKPDFEKVFYALRCGEKLWDHYLKEWENILTGSIPYNVKDNDDLKQLIKEYKLEAHYNDLLFIANRCQKQKDFDDRTEEFIRMYAGHGSELLQALKFLFDNELTDIRIEFKHKKKNLSVSINNVARIYSIRKVLIDLYIEDDIYFKQGWAEPDNIRYWGKYIDFIINKDSVHEPKKGRKTKHHSTGLLISFLQRYLQEYTEIKAEEGIVLSRSQATFISKFLKLLNFLKDDYAWEEDNMRHILVKFLSRSKENAQSLDIKEIMINHKKEEKEYKAKIKEINKNK